MTKITTLINLAKTHTRNFIKDVRTLRKIDAYADIIEQKKSQFDSGLLDCYGVQEIRRMAKENFNPNALELHEARGFIPLYTKVQKKD